MSKLIVAPSPHTISSNSTSNIMFDVLLAMSPAFCMSVVYFGINAVLVTAVCVASCVLFEYLSRKLMKRSNTISDLSAVVTGVLLAFNLPPNIPLWVAVIGSFFAIVIAKQLFGGIGQNFANPAIVGRVVLFMSFATYMTTWTQPFSYIHGVDMLASATPLADNFASTTTFDLFIGNISGCLGEVSAAALLLGGVYLVIRRVINPLIPVTFIGTVFVLTFLFGENPLNHILSGGLMLGAIFMATDYSTTPATIKGKFIFALGCGLLTALIRVFGSYPEGVSFAILFMNLLSPLIDRFTLTRPFGVIKRGKAKNV